MYIYIYIYVCVLICINILKIHMMMLVYMVGGPARMVKIYTPRVLGLGRWNRSSQP